MRAARFLLWLAWLNLAFLVFEAALNAIGTVIKI
jgi:hypothetical protein